MRTEFPFYFTSAKSDKFNSKMCAVISMRGSARQKRQELESGVTLVVIYNRHLPLLLQCNQTISMMILTCHVYHRFPFHQINIPPRSLVSLTAWSRYQESSRANLGDINLAVSESLLSVLSPASSESTSPATPSCGPRMSPTSHRQSSSSVKSVHTCQKPDPLGQPSQQT